MADDTTLPQTGTGEMVTRRQLLRATGVLGTGTMAGLAGCSGDTGGGTTTTGGDTTDAGGQQTTATPGPTEVVIGPATGPTTLDPHNHRETTTATVLVHFYDGLVMRDNQMKIQPRLAKEWSNPDPTTWEFTLREGVTFSNGEEFTADVARYNLRRVAGLMEGAAELPIRDQYASIESVEAPEDYFLRVNLKAPDPLFLENQAGLRYVSKQYTQENGFEALNENPVGTGPYTLEEWTRDEQLVMSGRSDYFRGTPPIDRAVWQPMPESSSRLAGLLDGSVDIIRSVNPRSVPRIKNTDGTEVAPVRSVRAAALWLNLEQSMVGRDEPLFYGRPKLRKAVNYAIDVESIRKNILSGYGYRIHGWAPSKEFVGYNPNIQPYGHDPDRAQQLMEEAGYGDGFEAKLLVPRGRYFKGVASSEAIATQLGEVGIDVELNAVEFGQFAEKTQQHKMPEFMFAAWGNSTFNALNAYVPLVKSNSIFSLLPNKDDQDWVKTVDDKISTAQQTADREKLDQILQELEALMHEWAPFVFMFQYQDLYGVNSALEWKPRSDELMYVYNAEMS